ncbi:DNA cytosine methyltransferase [Hoyosella sp. G463]|uniref:DNA (cytosine-5-)-methyltransferase n=1 Tax=Lolliginicoccus lacisalsi TaxID=2742202 RepID=A0A927JF96_9ACTN|nr:DNA cytosine methyltransferase [Lolliginicoccus lacisalsi]
MELFAGGGGLALGTHLAGFSTEIVAEWNRWCCDTLRENAASGHPLVQGVHIHEGDVRDADWTRISGNIDLVSGGPPCQPFSSGGKAGAADDPRDMFPTTAEVIRVLHPRAFIVENVRGLTRPAFADYFSYIQLRLTHPELASKPGESWSDHFARLQVEHLAIGSDLQYKVEPTIVNAANFGVPQQRWRVFLVGIRSDVDARWKFPEETHSADALAYSQHVSGEYWERHKVPRDERTPKPLTRKLDQLREHGPLPMRQPWRTVRDAIGSMTEPDKEGTGRFLNHVLQPGARSYRGHTGSPIDAPSKALKSGVHGVPGGENMLRRADGSIRYFTVREAARLQTFPDDYQLYGPWGEAMRQIGNAVPVQLAEIVARSLYENLALADLRAKLSARQSASLASTATA